MKYCTACKGKKDKDGFRGQLNTCKKCESEQGSKRHAYAKEKASHDFHNMVICNSMIGG